MTPTPPVTSPGKEVEMDIDRGDALGLPLPRLQLTWQKSDEANEWFCHYELLVPAPNWDIRNEAERGYIPIPINTTKVGTSRTPAQPDGKLSTPFRDGVHVANDAAALKLRAYVVWGNASYNLHTATKESHD